MKKAKFKPEAPTSSPPRVVLGEGMVEAFRGLTREMHWSQYMLLRCAVVDMMGEEAPQPYSKLWSSFNAEHDGVVFAEPAGGGPIGKVLRLHNGPYGQTLQEAMKAPTTASDRYMKWTDVFLSEVDLCLERYKGSPLLVVEVEKLKNALRDLEMGKAEAAPLFALLCSKGRGRQVITQIQEEKERLLVMLQDRFVRLSAIAKPKPAKVRPEIPSLGSKFDKVPGSLDKWMGLLRSEGLVDAAGSFTMASDVKGKGKLIAAWDAAQSVFSLIPYPYNTILVRALNAHFPGLDFSGRLDRVRFTNDFDAIRDGYKKTLREN